MIEHIGNELFLKYAPKGCDVLELGNQIMNLEKIQNISAKKHYSSLGYNHISVDQNGKDGAIEVDLSKPIILDGKNLFDIITDFGTTEHVENLYECLRNVFNYCKEGGIMLHKNPKTGNFPGHGYHFFTIEFWNQYAKLSGLEIIELFEHPIYHNTKTGWECIAILRKTNKSNMLSEESFNKISNLVYSI